ncbi:hypothetical protein SELMODRAFT_100459 [Selaginella moellendorffii]|uniref:Uncharacterized protein n=1 Tax=Selaginella moellendorffii TaxID=88036 RepID=D8RSQ9_SELML|nr:hypothetical protein SELMODRAFT_121948 [Selaginella moellendorffii]EFJ25117.1 hypothetical protein SELMODRAFT_100459 [Selaginella moellendorffii]
MEFLSSILNFEEILLDLIGSLSKVNISLPSDYPLKPLKIMWKGGRIQRSYLLLENVGGV